MTMRAKEGIGAEWSLRGIAWRASPDRSVWVGELEEGASTVVRAALFEPLDGVPKMLAAACGQRNAGRRCRRILVDAAESVSGLGAISDAAAQAMLQEGSARLGVPPDALRIFSAGPLMTLPPVGERLAALDAALASQPLKAPEGFASFPFMMPEGCVEIGFGVWERGGSGARTFFAGLDLGVAPEILETLLARVWLAGPAALRAAEGAMPGDALVLVATGAGGMPPVLVSDDPRIESLSAGLALAAEGWMRRRMREASPSRRILRIQGAASSEEVERAAAEIIRSLRAGAPVENLSAADLAARVWAGLLGARIELLERTPLGVALGGRALLEKGTLRADAGPGAWKDSEAPLVVRLGRGAADGLFWL